MKSFCWNTYESNDNETYNSDQKVDSMSYNALTVCKVNLPNNGNLRIASYTYKNAWDRNAESCSNVKPRTIGFMSLQNCTRAS